MPCNSAPDSKYKRKLPSNSFFQYQQSLNHRLTIGSQYESRGCWKDRTTTPRTLTDIDIDIPKTFGSHYKKRKDPILHCLQAAIARGYVVFALQDGGQCFGSSSLKQGFPKEILVRLPCLFFHECRFAAFWDKKHYNDDTKDVILIYLCNLGGGAGGCHMNMHFWIKFGQIFIYCFSEWRIFYSHVVVSSWP